MNRMKQKFEFNIWNFVSMEAINNVLDEVTEKTGQTEIQGHIATDISYKCLSITKDGTIKVEAEYTPEEY